MRPRRNDDADDDDDGDDDDDDGADEIPTCRESREKASESSVLFLFSSFPAVLS